MQYLIVIFIYFILSGDTPFFTTPYVTQSEVFSGAEESIIFIN